MNQEDLEFLKGLMSVQPIIVKEEYRAYYDDTDKILYTAANDFPENNDNWISITKIEYQTLECQWLWQENGKIVERKPNYNYYFSLHPSTKGVKIVKDHAGIVVEPGEEYIDVGYYDKRNS
jgi:hypothetical protein